MKKFLFVPFLSMTIIGCFAPAQTTAPMKQTFTFDYNPKETNQVGSAKMVLAFIKPHYAQDFTSKSSELFKRFQNALETDIAEVINTKGFNLRGPFVSFDELVFEDKQRTDMIINIEIAPEFTAQQGGWRSSFTLMNTNRTLYSYSGKASLVGKINISGVEPLTNEKIWSKSVSIPNVEDISIQTTHKYERMLNGVELVNDPGVYNALGTALQAQYAGIMDKITAHFSVAEFNSMKPQIKELKAKKGY